MTNLSPFDVAQCTVTLAGLWAILAIARDYFTRQGNENDSNNNQNN